MLHGTWTSTGESTVGCRGTRRDPAGPRRSHPRFLCAGAVELELMGVSQRVLLLLQLLTFALDWRGKKWYRGWKADVCFCMPHVRCFNTYCTSGGSWSLKSRWSGGCSVSVSMFSYKETVDGNDACDIKRCYEPVDAFIICILYMT